MCNGSLRDHHRSCIAMPNALGRTLYVLVMFSHTTPCCSRCFCLLAYQCHTSHSSSANDNEYCSMFDTVCAKEVKAEVVVVYFTRCN